MAIKISSMKLVLGLWSSLLLLSRSHQRARTANSNYELRGDTIIVSAKSALATRIKVDTLAEEYQRTSFIQLKNVIPDGAVIIFSYTLE